MERIGLLVYQGAHAIPGGPPGDPLVVYSRVKWLYHQGAHQGAHQVIPGGPPGGPLRLYQGAHQGAHYGSPTRGPTCIVQSSDFCDGGLPPGGPPGGPLRVLTSYFCRGVTHGIIIYNRYLSFWNRKRLFDYVSIRTNSSVFPLIRGWQFMSLWLVRVIVLIFLIGERWKIKT
jgi:hypothetical protein